MKYILIFLFFLYSASIHAERQDIELTLRVNVLDSNCTLVSGSQTIDFGEMYAYIGIDNVPTREAIFRFEQCKNVEKIKINFKGNNVDINNNLIRNRNDDSSFASGIGVKLFNEKGNLITLKDDIYIPVNNNKGSELFLKAKVASIENEILSPGILDTSVELQISYD